MDINSPIALISASVAAIVLLRVFFTLWGPLDRKLNGTARSSREIGLAELQSGSFNVRLTSGTVLENVALSSRYASELDDLDDLDGFDDPSRMLALRAEDGRKYFVRASEIEFFEQAPASPPPPPSLPDAPHSPDPDAPENWG